MQLYILYFYMCHTILLVKLYITMIYESFMPNSALGKVKGLCTVVQWLALLPHSKRVMN